MRQNSDKKYLRLMAYLAGFFLTVHVAFPSYFNAQFLEQFVGEKWVGMIFALSSLLTIIMIVSLPKITRRFGLSRTILGFSLLDILLVLSLVFSSSAFWAVFLFILYYSFGFAIRFALDLYLEKVSDNRATGDIRGIFLTFINLAWLVSPFLAGSLIESQGFPVIYAISAIALLPLFYIAATQFKEKAHHRLIPEPRLHLAVAKLWRGKNERDRNIARILGADFFLNLFYAVMVIYMGYYLEEYIGMTTEEIGKAFTIMLLPFVLFEFPLGRIADKWLGEKEILISGFIIAGVATSLIPWIGVPTVAVWATLLFITRVGACSVEIMKETYLFKKVDEEDTDILSLSRIMQPISYLVGPMLVFIALPFVGLRFIFLGLGLITLSGALIAARIKDTK